MPITRIPSPNYGERDNQSIEHIIIHYTAAPVKSVISTFCNASSQVSAHYLVQQDGTTLQFVDEENSAWHAGKSSWSGSENLNKNSIGIETECIGFEWGPYKFMEDEYKIIEGMPNKWRKYDIKIFEPLILLCQDIIKRHNIKPYNILGHSDIAPGNKFDPGPLFPWQELAEKHGIGLWYDIKESNIKELPENYISQMQQLLSNYGYQCKNTGIADEQTINVIRAFEAHFMQKIVNGEHIAGSLAGEITLKHLQIIDSLCQRKAQLILQDQQTFQAKTSALDDNICTQVIKKQKELLINYKPPRKNAVTIANKETSVAISTITNKPTL